MSFGIFVRTARSRSFGLLLVVAGLLALPGGLPESAAAIINIKTFLDQCPTLDPVYAQIRADFPIYRNGQAVGTISCTEPVSEMPIAEYTSELDIAQALRVIYYMDLGRSHHLPWTPGTFYGWLKSRLTGGIAINNGGVSYCCDQIAPGKLAISIAASNDVNRDYHRSFQGMSALVALIGHETRHIDGFGHDSACGTPNGCDLTYDEANLSPYGIQYWLNKHWLTGDINVGISCLPAISDNTNFPTTPKAVGEWLLAGANGYRSRFSQTIPPLLTAPTVPGGPCQFVLPPGAAQGLWWRAAEAGWGVNFAHQGDIVFATWFTYDIQGQPYWWAAELHPSGERTFRGDMFHTSGPPFDAVPWSPTKVSEVDYGTMTVTFHDVGWATFSYALDDGHSRSTLITKQAFGTVPTCAWNSRGATSLIANYTDLWWVPGGAEAGWGINLAHQGNIVFATWFTYDALGHPWWLIAELRWQPSIGGYSGTVSAVTGPKFGASFDPTKVVETVVGSATLNFPTAGSAKFDYTVKGRTQTKMLARQVFVAPGTTCH